MVSRVVKGRVRLVIMVVRIFKRMVQNVIWILGIARMLFILLIFDQYNGKENCSSLGLTIYISNLIITI